MHEIVVTKESECQSDKENTMKIKTKEMSYERVLTLPPGRHKNPPKQSSLMRNLIKILSKRELKKVHFRVSKDGMDGIGQGEPCLYLMNHSSFIDLEIAFTLISPKPFHIICTSDGFVGKERLMRAIGCIPTRKFVTDVTMVRDMFHAVRKLNSSVLMYPEASYTFDGTATPLPKGLGQCVKKLGIPVVMIETRGAFLRDPLYNGLQLRKVDVSAQMKCLLTKEQITALSTDDINEVLREAFAFDQFRNQQEDGVRVTEPFRADGLHRVLYRCPSCQKEGQMRGEGIALTCHACNKGYVLTEDGRMQARGGETEFTHIPDWYRWERTCVREELKNQTYRMDIPVHIGVMKDMKSIYMVGEGWLRHDKEGFCLTGCDGKLEFKQSPSASYSLYADYFWYEIGDMISIGDMKQLYYCFPKNSDTCVAKARLATEELFFLHNSQPN